MGHALSLRTNVTEARPAGWNEFVCNKCHGCIYFDPGEYSRIQVANAHRLSGQCVSQPGFWRCNVCLAELPFSVGGLQTVVDDHYKGSPTCSPSYVVPTEEETKEDDEMKFMPGRSLSRAWLEAAGLPADRTRSVRVIAEVDSVITIQAELYADKAALSIPMYVDKTDETAVNNKPTNRKVVVKRRKPRRVQ